ncbi:MAG: hypothetical protein BGO31_00075 [Bacteroidetes bacterium 43-16]|uniref:hypothetical protein n=1 Tax=uncultured Dysgonomonas sp. TaxID=206096 RepID=UPI000928996E|nr:hypothetical protein [uncultured Dysgonomonas sp.]OJV51635.1 MAG: hypothetical protein BGO31_00075 [Bacteroidetes bacterium 43-16]
MNSLDRIEYTKYQIWSLIIKSGAKGIEDIEFSYRRDGNDEYTKHGKQRRMATLEFYLHTPAGRTLIVYKEHKRTHDEVENELEKRYKRWVYQYFKKSLTNKTAPAPDNR